MQVYLFAVAIKACALCLPAATCIASGNPNFFRVALAAFVEVTVGRLAPYANFLAGLADGIHHIPRPFPETFTAGLIWLRSVLPADCYVPLRAKLLFVVHTVSYRTF